MMSRTSWYRPANTVGFFPATPNAVLAKKFQEILTEELNRLKMNGRIIEESGVSLKRLLVKVDLTVTSKIKISKYFHNDHRDKE